MAGVGAVILFAGIALYQKGLLIDVEYQQANVIDVIQVPGETMSDRLVIVDLGQQNWPIRTSDRLLRVSKGEMACIAKRKMLARRWIRYTLVLPGFCRNLR